MWSAMVARDHIGVRSALQVSHTWHVSIRLAGAICWRMRWLLLGRWIWCSVRHILLLTLNSAVLTKVQVRSTGSQQVTVDGS